MPTAYAKPIEAQRTHNARRHSARPALSASVALFGNGGRRRGVCARLAYRCARAPHFFARGLPSCAVRRSARKLLGPSSVRRRSIPTNLKTTIRTSRSTSASSPSPRCRSGFCLGTIRSWRDQCAGPLGDLSRCRTHEARSRCSTTPSKPVQIIDANFHVQPPGCR
jgi:hypothetical protein